MRKDVFTGRWVIMAETSAVRPSDFHFKRFGREKTFCPFCETNEASTPPEVFAIRKPGSFANGPGWSARVVPNVAPRLRIEGDLGRRAEGFHDLMNGVGAHEIIVETPSHNRSLHEFEIHGICDVIRAHIARIVDLEGDKRMRYVLIFKNHGEEAGAHSMRVDHRVVLFDGATHNALASLESVRRKEQTRRNPRAQCGKAASQRV